MGRRVSYTETEVAIHQNQTKYYGKTTYITKLAFNLSHSTDCENVH